MKTQSFTPLLSCLILCCLAHSSATAQQRSSGFVWPMSRLAQPSSPIALTFGPSINASNDAYVFHRGIDIPAKQGTPVYAIADGTIRLAGLYDYYRSPVVQIRHYKNASRSCKNGGCFYSNYMHLERVSVAEGESVNRGELIGFSGKNEDGFGHLHFEIRDTGVYQRNCIHPLTVLPYANRSGPKIKLAALLADEHDHGYLEITLSAGRNECDLRRVEVSVYDTARKIAERVYDMVDLNHMHSPAKDPNGVIQQQDFQDVIVKPYVLQDKKDCQLSLIFYNLPKIVLNQSYQVKVEAFDARGRSTDVTRRMRAQQRNGAPKTEAVAGA